MMVSRCLCNETRIAVGGQQSLCLTLSSSLEHSTWLLVTSGHAERPLIPSGGEQYELTESAEQKSRQRYNGLADIYADAIFVYQDQELYPS